MLELIKGQLKYIKKLQLDQAGALPSHVTDIKWVLQKFMIALDIHYYFRSGSIKNACKSIIDFVTTFKAYLTYQEKVKLLSQAFYYIITAKNGSVLLPDYALRFMDFGFNLHAYYQDTVDILGQCDYCDYESGEKQPFEEEERDVIQKTFEGLDFEVIQDDTMYN